MSGPGVGVRFVRGGNEGNSLQRMTMGGMIIPYERLSQEALHGLINEFVTRPGTDTGYTETTLEQNIDMVKRQLKRGDAIIVYDETTQTANIVPKKQMTKFSGETVL
jgi:uncharacterized protein